MSTAGIPWSAERHAKNTALYGTSEERLWRNIEFDTNGGCWLWAGVVPSRSTKSYGAMRHQGRQQRAHRVAWLLFRGEIPPGLYVCHRCDTPACVNPAHLFLGTAKDNNEDCRRKGRWAGPPPPRSDKLSSADVLEIVRRADAGETSAAIAADYGVRPKTVNAIRCGLARSSVTGRSPGPGDHCKPHLITWRGQTRSISDWARDLGMTHVALRYRLARGWSLDAALSTPPRRPAR